MLNSMSTLHNSIKYDSRNVLQNISKQEMKDATELWVFKTEAEHELKRKMASRVPAWQLEELNEKEQVTFRWAAENAPIFLIRSQSIDGSWENSSEFGKGRDLVGAWARENMFAQENLKICFFGVSKNFVKG